MGGWHSSESLIFCQKTSKLFIILHLKTFIYLPTLDPKMTGKTYIMGCTVDGLAFGTAAEGLQHYNGKKHRAKIARHLKDLTQEKCAIHIKGTTLQQFISSNIVR